MDYGALQQRNEQLEAEVIALKEELKEVKRLLFGSKRERFVGQFGPGQLSLLADEAPTVRATSQKQTYQRVVNKPATTTPPSRKLLPAHLPRVEVLLEPNVDTSAMKKIGEQISEELDADGQSTNQ